MENVSPCKLPIDWGLLYVANNFYADKLNSIYMETPWIVEPKVADITAPHTMKNTQTGYGQLVGSAEQGFLQLIHDSNPNLEKNKFYHSISPCFREDVMDELHERHFMKLELIYPSYYLYHQHSVLNNYEHDSKILHQMVQTAERFFNINGIPTRVVTTETEEDKVIAYDIVGEKSGIELGSYGLRKANTVMWVYGTGLALPRFTKVKEIENAIR